MNRDTDNRLREMLDDAAAKELVPAFDKAALWPRIEPRIRRRAPLRVALPWLSHAAAVAAGLLLAWIFLVKNEDDRGPVWVAMQGARVQAKAAPASETLLLGGEHSVATTDAVADDEQAIQSDQKRINTARLSPKPRPDSLLHPQDEEQIAIVTADATNADVPAPQTPVAQKSEAQKNNPPSKQPAPVVVHLLDVSGDGAERLRKPVEPLPARRAGLFARLLSRHKVPDLTGTAAANAMVQRTYLSR